MSDSACTFAATPGPLYSNFEKVSSQPGCCVVDGSGVLTSAYGLNNTCHVLVYQGNAEPYRLTVLDQNAGNLSLSTGQCIAIIMKLQSTGDYSTGNGTGPSDAGLASKYGYDGCVVDASSNPDSASSKKNSAGVSLTGHLVGVRGVLLLGLFLPVLFL